MIRITNTPLILTVVLIAACHHTNIKSVPDPAELGQAAFMHDKLAGNWKKHTVTRLDPDYPNLKMPALFQYVSEPWNRIALYPFMQYMPEKNRLIAVMGCDRPHVPFLTTSDDGGATWTEPRKIRDDVSRGLGNICYLGNGRIIVTVNNPPRRCYSDDYGETFPRTVPVNKIADGVELHDSMGTPFIDRNPRTGQIDRLVNVRYEYGYEKKHSQPYIRFSTNMGKTWTPDKLVPQWSGFNEVEMVRAKNGDLVCVLRSDVHKRYKNRNDHFGGMGVSISKDNGQTWSNVNLLYEWGRHHQSPVVMPNGDIVVSYVVREGYPPNENGYPTFGIEAIVSHDHGQTWDLDHIYVLYEWDGHLVDNPDYWMASPQITSTAVLPDGDLVTIFSGGEREIGFEGDPRQIGVVRWHLAQ